MTVDLATRKPTDRLTMDDLKAFPMWEFCLDEEDVEEQDETWVRPLDAKTVPLGAFSLSVAADFVAANGVQYEGLVDVSTGPDGIEFANIAVLLVGGRYLPVPENEAGFATDMRRKFSSIVGGIEETVFPLTFSLRIPIEGETERRRGIIS
ncbi:MAG TPA: hypothetical protein VJM82_01825 [Nitrospiraceae bacterium]|nr:hypothetical protein [Nitrospiraceae bacterium]